MPAKLFAKLVKIRYICNIVRAKLVLRRSQINLLGCSVWCSKKRHSKHL